MTETPTLATPSATVLPDLPGKVHGIKELGPVWAVQCDDCLTVFRGRVLIIVVQAAIFNPHIPALRLCKTCWAARGWTEDYHGWHYQAPRTKEN